MMISWTFLQCVLGIAIISSMMNLRGKKIKRENDGNSLTPSILTQQDSRSEDAVSDDVEAMNTRPKRRKEGHVESSNTTNNNKSLNSNNVDPIEHQCRFCGLMFMQSQALGGHMNRHRSEKQQEEMQKAELLLASKQQYFGSAAWAMHGGGGNPYYGGNPISNSPLLGTSLMPNFFSNQAASTPQNLHLNQALAGLQQNAHTMQGGGHYNPIMDNTRSHHGITSQGDVIPTGQVHGRHIGSHINSGPPSNSVYSDSRPMLHGGTDTVQPHGSTLNHLNQAGSSNFQDNLNMATLNNQQAQSNNPIPSFIHHSAGHQNRIQLVDQYGNPVHENQPGHNFQMPQDYTQTAFDQKHGTSMGGLRNKSAGIRSEHNQAPGHGISQIPSLDTSHNIQGGTDQSATLMESGQAGLEGSTDTPIDDHTSSRLLRDVAAGMKE